MTKLRIGVDVGGTFTDVVGMDDTGTIRFAKTPSTPQNQAVGVIDGIRKILDIFGATPADVAQIVHGTTVATNALLERAGARTALITTSGFRDVLHIGRQDRPSLYDLTAARPEPLVSRRYRREVDERILHDGRVERPLDVAQLRDLVRELVEEDIEAIAICFLHSYANPTHEQQAAAIVREMAPHLQVSASCEILSEFREFERVSTTVINAYVQGAMDRYLKSLVTRLREEGIAAPLMVMQSNGGMMSASAAASRAINTLLSGPAGGVLASSFLAELLNDRDFITADVGGTSFDVSIVEKGVPALRTEGSVEGYAVKFPHIDIHTIGAGGGSIAWVDAGGALRVGPRSAGAKPGPVCYQRGGTEPTVCDAFAALGWLGERSLLAGQMSLDIAAARAAIDARIARPLGLDVETAAEGIVRVAKAAMCRAIRLITVERGQDPRRFTLLPYGGAGPLHASDIARELGIGRILVPVAPGNFSAFGVLAAPILYDEVTTCRLALDDGLDLAGLTRRYEELEERLTQRLLAEGCAREAIVYERKADLRYRGQAYELSVPVTVGALDPARFAETIDAFHALHERLYGFARLGTPLELVNLRAAGKVPTPRNGLGASAADGELQQARRDMRRIYLDGAWTTAPVYWRDHLAPHARITGPAVIEENGSTFILFAGDELAIDPYGAMEIVTVSADQLSEVA